MKIKFLKLLLFYIVISSATINISIAAEKQVKNYYVITQQQWSMPKNAQSILAMPALHSVMNTLSLQAKPMLLIRYPGGDVGVLWASELKGWLVALGLASERIELQSGSTKIDELEILIN